MEFDSTKAALMTMTVGVIGLLINFNVAYAVKKCRCFGYAFGTLCFSQSLANIANCCVFVFFTAGITFANPSFHATYLGRRSGQLLIFFWEVSIFSHLFISINRAIAVILPTRYNAIFSDNRVTNVIVGIIWFIAAAQAFPYSFPKCSMLFDPDVFTYEYSSSTCGILVEQIGDLYVSIVVVAIIGILDITSFLRLRKLLAHNADRKTKSKEIRLFFQACVQSVLFMFCECSFFFLSYLSTNLWYSFASTTFIWVVTHSLDGVVVIVFSGEIRRIILRKSETSTVRPSMAVNTI